MICMLVSSRKKSRLRLLSEAATAAALNFAADAPATSEFPEGDYAVRLAPNLAFDMMRLRMLLT
jgi:hypothetical protein